MNKLHIIEYFKNGNLMVLLGHNGLSEVWLGTDELGVIHHTFVRPDNDESGHIVPRSASEAGRIFSGAVQEVSEFLKGFGLSDAEADEVITAVGTAP